MSQTEMKRLDVASEELTADEQRRVAHMGQRYLSDNGLDGVAGTEEVFVVSEELLQSVLVGAPDVAYRDTFTDTVCMEWVEVFALGDASDEPRKFDTDGTRGFLSVQLTTTPDGDAVEVFRVDSDKRDNDTDRRPRVCECDDGDSLPCRFCFAEGFDVAATVE